MKRKLQKIIAVTFVTSMFSMSAFAQKTDKGISQKNLSENGSPSLITFNEKSDYKRSDSKKALKDQLSLNENQSFSKIKTETDAKGYTHDKFQLYQQGIKVEFATYTLHSKSEKLASMNGEFYNMKNVKTQASNSPQTALNIAISLTLHKENVYVNTLGTLPLGIPQKPNPPNIITAPSLIPLIAASAFATTLFIILIYKIKLREFEIPVADCFYREE